MSKKKCRLCGAKNYKESMICAACGAPLVSEQENLPVSRISAKDEARLMTAAEDVTVEKARDEYRAGEIVLYRTRGRVTIRNMEPQEAGILVTQSHLTIDLDEPVEIPLARIKDIQIEDSISATTINQASIAASEGMKISYLGEKSEKHWLSLQMIYKEQSDLQQAIYRQMVGRYISKAPERPAYQGFFGFLCKALAAIKEWRRDKVRDRICFSLQRLGADAQLAARGRFEEKISDINLHSGGYSLGVIRISEWPIGWVNVTKKTDRGEYSAGYYLDSGVADPRLVPGAPQPYLRFANSRWEGEDFGTGLAERLNGDLELKRPFLKTVKIAAVTDYGCWLISGETDSVPADVYWNCHQAIAGYLLADWPK